MARLETDTEALLVVTAQQLHPQSDALVPFPGQDAHVLGVKRRLEDVLFVAVVVHVALEKLQRRSEREKKKNEHKEEQRH